MTRWTMPLVALGGGLVGAGVMHWGGGGAGVRDYLLAHPEVITEAMGRLQERESAKAVAANRPAIETPVGSAWSGNPRGDVTLVEFYDYNCGFCRASLPVLDRLVADDPKLRVVYREMPVLAETSRDAARVSLLAADQGKFARFHQALYAAGPVSPDTIAAAASSAGVDVRALDPDALDKRLHSELALARALGMTGTPSWVVGDRVISGAVPLDQLKQAIAAARAAKG